MSSQNTTPLLSIPREYCKQSGCNPTGFMFWVLPQCQAMQDRWEATKRGSTRGKRYRLHTHPHHHQLPTVKCITWWTLHSIYNEGQDTTVWLYFPTSTNRYDIIEMVVITHSQSLSFSFTQSHIILYWTNLARAMGENHVSYAWFKADMMVWFWPRYEVKIKQYVCIEPGVN